MMQERMAKLKRKSRARLEKLLLENLRPHQFTIEETRRGFKVELTMFPPGLSIPAQIGYDDIIVTKKRC